jgi:Phage gp6-like head-tail connector protein
MLHLVRTIAPAVEPVSIAQAHQHLRLPPNYTTEDGLLSLYIKAARDYCERYCNRAFITQTYQLGLNAFPFYGIMNASGNMARYRYGNVYLNEAMQINLPRPPLQSVTSITYVDATNTPQTMDPSTYYVDNAVEPGILLPQNGVFWPYPSQFLSDTIKITYKAGYPEITVTETHNLPSTIPYTVALANQNLISITTVVYGESGAPLTAVASNPAQGQYSYSINALTFDPSTALAQAVNALLTFNPADAGQAVTVTYQTFQVPEGVTIAMLLLIATLYENRSDVSQGVSISKVPLGVNAWLQSEVFDPQSWE